MTGTICGRFETRREAELAVEHLVQDHGLDRKAVSVRAEGARNTAGTEAAGADVESGHPGVEKHGAPQLAGMIEVRVEGASDRAAVEKILREAGGQVG
jgi:hypothetical protein